MADLGTSHPKMVSGGDRTRLEENKGLQVKQHLLT